MSGTPVFSLFEAGLAGNEIREIKGILNGTTNFILTKMERTTWITPGRSNWPNS